MATPAWLGATSGQRPQASQVNQFLGAHAVSYLYTGALIGSQTTLGSGSATTATTYVAQSFTTPASTVALGRIVLDLTSTGSPPPVSISIQAAVGAAPSGTPLVTTSVPADYVGGIVSIPVPYASLAASTQYWIVAAIGTSGSYFSWLKSNQTSGASASTNGTSWTAQTYGLYYAYYDQTVTAPLTHTWEDAGARWTAPTYNANGTPASLREYTVAQGTGGYVYSLRSFAYGGAGSGYLISIT